MPAAAHAVHAVRATAFPHDRRAGRRWSVRGEPWTVRATQRSGWAHGPRTDRPRLHRGRRRRRARPRLRRAARRRGRPARARRRTTRPLAKVAAALGGAERAIAVSGDLTDPGIETCLVAAAIARYGRLDGALVGVAAPGPRAPSSTPTTATGGSGSRTLFLAPLRLCRAVDQQRVAGGRLARARAVDVGPRAGRRGHALPTGLRPALAMTAKALADELGPARRARQQPAAGPDRGADVHRRALGRRARRPPDAAPRARIPLRRYGEPLEFARPAVFLLSPAAELRHRHRPRRRRRGGAHALSRL